MKRGNLFPLLAGIFLIYLLCRLTYQGGNQEGFIEGFLEGQAAADPSAPTTKCTETGTKAYQAWKKCYDAYTNVCNHCVAGDGTDEEHNGLVCGENGFYYPECLDDCLFIDDLGTKNPKSF